MQSKDECPLCQHEIVNMLLDNRASSVVQSLHAFIVAFNTVQELSGLPMYYVVAGIMDEVHRSHSA